MASGDVAKVKLDLHRIGTRYQVGQRTAVCHQDHLCMLDKRNIKQSDWLTSCLAHRTLFPLMIVPLNAYPQSHLMKIYTWHSTQLDHRSHSPKVDFASSNHYTMLGLS